MNIRLTIAACALAAIPISPAVVASDGLRCGNKLVTVGDSQAEVRAKCGEPDDISRSVITERRTDYRVGRVRLADKVEIEVSVQSELWLYNFGSSRFMGRMRFIDGTLDSIETLGYGYER